MEVKKGQNIRAGERAARVAGTGDPEHLDDVAADGQRRLRENLPVDFLIHCGNL